MPVMGHTISLTRLVTEPTSIDNPDRQPGVLGDNLREVRSAVGNAGLVLGLLKAPQLACHALSLPLFCLLCMLLGKSSQLDQFDFNTQTRCSSAPLLVLRATLIGNNESSRSRL